MSEIIGVRLNDSGRIFYFKPKKQNVNVNDMVIVDSSKGLACGKVVIKKEKIFNDKILNKIKPIIRKAEEKDIVYLNKLKNKRKRAFNICNEKIKKYNLKMKLLDVECTFDNKKILFYFLSDDRIDFRNLVKDLATIFKMRIELRQVGVRDEAKFLGALGKCGNPICCSTFLNDFHSVSIKMAKDQGLSLNPTKISGSCGKLMCCLKYEQEAYEKILKYAPRIGAIVETPKGVGTVIEQNLIIGIFKVRLNDSQINAPLNFKLNELKIIKNGKNKIKKEDLASLKKLE